MFSFWHLTSNDVTESVCPPAGITSMDKDTALWLWPCAPVKCWMFSRMEESLPMQCHLIQCRLKPELIMREWAFTSVPLVYRWSTLEPWHKAYMGHLRREEERGGEALSLLIASGFDVLRKGILSRTKCNGKLDDLKAAVKTSWLNCIYIWIAIIKIDALKKCLCV